MPTSTRRLPLITSLALAGLTALPAQAIVSTSNPSGWTSSSLDDILGLSENALDGVARISIAGGGGCSGTLLSGGAYVLTAAHCVTNSSGVLTASGATLWFDNGAVSASVSSASQISVYGSWNGQVGQNNDLALLRLDSAVTSVSGFSFYTDSVPVGTDVLLAGYGYTGTGSTGYTNTSMQSAVHWGANEYEGLLYDNPAWDFDNGSANQNTLSLMGYDSSTGLSSLEANIAPGDSGGPSFALLSGQLYLLGVHSFIARLNDGSGDLDTSLNASYGEVAADTVLFADQRNWIASVTSPIPEPGSVWMALAGLGLLGARRRPARAAPSSPQAAAWPVPLQR